MNRESKTVSLELLSKFMPGGMFQCLNDEMFTIIWMSDVFCEMTGYTREEIQEKYNSRFWEMVGTQVREKNKTVLEGQRKNKTFVELEFPIVQKDGRLLWVLSKGRYFEMPDKTETFVCFLMDITARKNIEEELRFSLERYQVIMDQATDIIIEWDIKEDTLFTSSNWEKKFGYKAMSADISRNLIYSSKIHKEERNSLVQIMKEIRDGKSYAETEIRIANLTGIFTWCRIRLTTQYDVRKQPVKAVGVILDIEDQKNRQQELLKAAHHDALTGLLNKEVCQHQTEKYLTGDMEKGAMILMDLDDFKRINDRYGHLCGDAVLSDTAGVLRKLFDGNVIGRIGGDEFLLFLPETDKKTAGNRAKEIGRLLKEKQLPDPLDVIEISAGIAGYPDDADNYFDLYRKADLALYHSKDYGKNSITLYDKEHCQRQGTGSRRTIRCGSVIESEKMTNVERRLVSYSFHMLYHSQNTEDAVNQLLEIVGRAYDVSRVYIFENTSDHKYCNNTFEWCNEGVQPQIEALQHISYEKDLDHYVDYFNSDGIFYCEDISTLDRKLYNILNPQKIKSMLQCAIIDDREFKGYVGFDECRKNRYWTKEQIKSLGLIANVLSEFLLKYRIKEQMKELMTQLSMIENNN